MSGYRDLPEPKPDDTPLPFTLVLHMSAGPLVVLTFCSAFFVPFGYASLAADRAGDFATLACASVFFFWPAVIWSAVSLAHHARWLRNGQRITFVVTGIGGFKTMGGGRSRVTGRDITLRYPEGREATVFVTRGSGWQPRIDEPVRGAISPSDPAYVVLEPLRSITRLGSAIVIPP